ncbi:uncharacterized protein EV420DRAFT_1480097 [Desarmillaria tabescens]|uniref:Uncharacterized protein n=1 Tax=Armillaria tabescens TaxID=1929756 RepID=A0AA39KBT9_ARMTA|nr:uncharacterized protein EV420DRAFT_1480097 [Desarmillaria tabescens]KAK0457913.1 hypothetical protein EV420DRAFT_1480097 [Desarmillaria tabescens]
MCRRRQVRNVYLRCGHTVNLCVPPRELQAAGLSADLLAILPTSTLTVPPVTRESNAKAAVERKLQVWNHFSYLIDVNPGLDRICDRGNSPACQSMTDKPFRSTGGSGKGSEKVDYCAREGGFESCRSDGYKSTPQRGVQETTAPVSDDGYGETPSRFTAALRGLRHRQRQHL